MSRKATVKKQRKDPIIGQSPVVRNNATRIVILPGGVGTISGKSKKT